MSSDTITYDTVQINTFLDVVFHTPCPVAENIFVQASPTAPKGYGIHTAELTNKLKATKVPMRCYFGTSTILETDDMMRFKRDAFCGMAVVVLDDIGTKIPVEKIADAGIEETYKIESSAGNFQYGLVLDEPITNYDHAMMLLRLVADKGFTDSGGCMPCKKVRLPCGMHGKSGAPFFEVKLHHMDGPYWTPQSILKAIGIKVEWEVLCEHHDSKRTKAKRHGAAAWGKVVNYSEHGLFDPILEWLYENDMVVDDSDKDGWIEFFCPWMDSHTSGSTTAGYNPIGRGAQPDRRGYNCFHGHCSGRGTEELLAKIVEWGGPHCPVREPFPDLTANHVLDVQNDMAWNIRGNVVRGMKTEMLRKTTPDVFLPREDKTALRANPVPLWMKLPSTVKVDGLTYDPSENSPLIQDPSDGTLRVNTFHMPDWLPAKVDMKYVQPFLDFVEYLIPSEDERDYFMEWLAAKVQNPAFRGSAIIMVAKSEGTGRNTLMQMIAKLFGTNNVVPVTMEDMLGGQWTDWRASLFAHVDESMAVNDGGKYRAYDRLKELVDPLSSYVTVNTKYAPQTKVKLATSLLFFSNHEDAIHVAENSRRFYGIHNNDVRAKPEYFSALHLWMGPFDKKTEWEQHVWNWFLAHPVDVTKMNGPAPRSDSLDDIVHASQGTLDILAEAALSVWDSPLIHVGTVLDMITGLEEGGMILPKGWRHIVTRIINSKTYSLRSVKKGGVRILYEGQQLSLRGVTLDMKTDEGAREEARARMSEGYMLKLNRRQYGRQIQDWVNERGYTL